MVFLRDALVHSSQNRENELLRRSWGWVVAKGWQCWGALIVFALKYQHWLEMSDAAADVFNHRAAERFRSRQTAR